MEGRKTLYAITAFIPPLIGIIGVVALSIAIAQDLNAPEPPPMAVAGMVIMCIAALGNLATVILYIIHIAQNAALDGGAKAAWIIGILFLSMLVPGIYYFVQIVPESQPVPPRPADDWDTQSNAKQSSPIMKTNKSLYAIMAFAPIAIVVLAVFVLFASIPELVRLERNSVPDEGTIGVLVSAVMLACIGGILSLVSMVLFIIHANKNPKIPEKERIFWMIGFFLANGILQIAYYFLFITKEVAEQEAQPKGDAFGQR